MRRSFLLRIDQLAGLGCCCFCSIQFITTDAVVQQNPELVSSFMKATQRGAAFTTEHPEEAFELFCQMKPQLRGEINKKIFIRTLPFFSRNLLNVERDWNKVCRYAKHLQLIDSSFDMRSVYTNAFVPDSPFSDIEPIACCLS